MPDDREVTNFKRKDKNKSINSFRFSRQFEFIEQEFIETSNRVYHGLRDIRNNLLNQPVSSVLLHIFIPFHCFSHRISPVEFVRSTKSIAIH